jgi:hypothetical protein
MVKGKKIIKLSCILDRFFELRSQNFEGLRKRMLNDFDFLVKYFGESEFKNETVKRAISFLRRIVD